MRYEHSDEVFVAIPFTKEFTIAYESVIEPAIKNASAGGRKLIPKVVNRGIAGAPDIHEKIFDGIIHSRFVIADMTVQASYSVDDDIVLWQPNSNVAYEVGLACAWRNPEDILLINQPHTSHRYSFDVQNLRHLEYRLDDPDSVSNISAEISNSLQTSQFLANNIFQKIVQTISPSCIQFLYFESQRIYPMIVFEDKASVVVDSRIHAASELMKFGALKTINVANIGAGKGTAIKYMWTKLG